MKLKKVHLKDFPDKEIRILLKDSPAFLEENIRYFGSAKKIAEFLSVSPQVISTWKRLRLFIPLEHVKKLVNERELDWNKIEKNVLAYKGPNLGLVVEKPKLPIIESAELFEI